ncbi:non-canonical purine NTP pyrophosphatase [Candidatus Uhrbacteria bacterium]|nr:non-canonical purine NTP pyrophosphatase [Candidatus Uhrbacteria bacterium]
MDFLLATDNPAKQQELSRLLVSLHVCMRNLTDYPHLPDFSEDAATFSENAIGKARWFAQATGLPTIADDGGLEIDALDGWPGVHSRRIFGDGRRATDEEMVREVLRKMQGIPAERRGCRMRTVVAFVAPTGEEWTAEGVDRGRIATTASSRRIPGYPFRSLFFHATAGAVVTELADHGARAMTHRRQAVAQLLPQLAAWVAQRRPADGH